MSNLLALVKVSLKTGFSNGINSKKKRKATHPFLWSIIGVIFLAVCLSAPIIAMINGLYDQLSQVGLQYVIVSMILVVACVAMFIFGIMYIMGTFYFSGDVQNLLPLPLEPYEIVGAKFITVLVYEYLTEAIFILLPLGAYGIKSEAGVMFWIGLIIIFLTLPIVPLVAAAILNMIIMSFTNMGKHKDALRVFGGILGVGLGIGINIFINSSATRHMSQETVMNLINTENGLVGFVTRMFPTAKFASLSLVGEGSKGILNLIIFLAITVGSLIIFYFVANALYFKGALGGSETFAKRKKLSTEEISKASKESSVFTSYVSKEVKMLLRTPAYLVNCVIPALIMPVVMIIFILIGGNKGGGDLSQIKNFVSSPEAATIAIVAVTCGALFMGSSNVISGTCISREGKNFFFIKYIPVSLMTQILSKVTVGVILGELGVVLVLIMAGFIGLSPMLILALIPLTLLGVLFSNLTAVIIDITGPKLEWDNEQMAVKQNFRAVLSTFLNLAIAGGLAFLSFKLKLDYGAQYALLAGILIIANLLIYIVINKKLEKWMDKLS